jgi:GTPase SAR1 family protein
VSSENAVKILVVGSNGSGKDLLLERVAAPVGDLPEAGVRFFHKTISVEDEEANLQIWEWVHGDNPHSLKPSFSAGASAAIVVFDVRSIFSFEQTKVWIRILQDINKIDPVMLVANYAQDAGRRVIPEKDGIDLAKERKCLYQEVNSTTGTDFETCLQNLVTREGILSVM